MNFSASVNEYKIQYEFQIDVDGANERKMKKNYTKLKKYDQMCNK